MPEMDEDLRFFLMLWESGLSVNKIVAKDKLRVYPTPAEWVQEEISQRFELLKYLMPGYCDSCHHWSMRRVEAYWQAHPHLCPNCLEFMLVWFETHQEWPEATWYKGEG
jgi:hypothetical protein